MRSFRAIIREYRRYSSYQDPIVSPALQNQANQLTSGLVSGLTSLQNDVRSIFNDPAFAIPGATSAEQYQNLINAIRNLNNGRKEGIYTNLGGKSGRGTK